MLLEDLRIRKILTIVSRKFQAIYVPKFLCLWKILFLISRDYELPWDSWRFETRGSSKISKEGEKEEHDFRRASARALKRN